MGNYHYTFFWAALIKATQFVAGSNQGISFGALEAGRGLVASIAASIAVILYSNNLLIEFISVISKNVSPISTVILFYSFLTFLSSLIILFFFRDTNKLKNKKKI